jgi:hypothetical protein
MQSLEFIEAGRRSAVKNDLAIYKDWLDNTGDAKDSIWKGIHYPDTLAKQMLNYQ